MASLSELVDNEDNQTLTNISEDCSSKMAGTDGIEKRVLLQAPSNGKKKKKRVGAPSGHRSGYHIFLKQECARLKARRQDLDGRRILRVAVDAWSKMSEIEKQPYVEESKKYKEESKEAMITHKGPSVCGETGGDYCVTSKPEVESVVTRAALDTALEMAKKASMDPLFLLDWDSYGLPPGEYK